ncbi:terminase large subunit [Caulobacter phage CcrRogue]|uniref:Intein-containing putative terminase large subunit n=2 Tax=Caulobacter phage CcrRogue TaxID=2927986 RepID=K4JSS5_9CAUD|nr:terminase large subunit [Caulobacter phage CcrRogue]AFU86813.1 intein-containing putative terminase large subunit precursor [Caulobacter phage CcrRogue]
MTFYPMEDRAKARSVVTNLLDLQREAVKVGRQGLILPPERKQLITQLTETEDHTRWVDLLGQFADRVQTDHLSRLKPIAKDDFNAFCEYVNPDEPPASKWHVFLTGTLQEIENNPELERFVLNCPPGHAKPLDVDTEVLMADGAWKRLGDIQVGDYVVGESGARCKVTAVHEQGDLDTLKITTAHGRQIIAAPDHSFRVGDGWKPAGKLRPGDALSVVGAANLNYDASGKSIDHFELAAYLQAKGGRSYFHRVHKSGPKTYRNVYLWTSDHREASQISTCLKRMGVAFKGRLAKTEKVWKMRLSTEWGDALAEEYGLDAKIDARRVPAFVTKGDEEQIGRYLSTLTSLAGEAPERYTIPRLVLYFKNPDFATDVQRLFAAVGVNARIEPRKTGRTRLHISGADLEAYFAAGLTYTGPNADKLPAKRAAFPTAPSTLADHVTWIEPHGVRPCRCLTVENEHTFIAQGVVVHNSTYASRLFVAWRLGRDPRQKIIGGGHSQRFVENEFSGKIRNLVRTPQFKDVFPGVVIDHATSAKDMWAIAGHGGQYAAKGAGQAIHGLRANFVCVDDPYPSIQKAESGAYREEVRTWFFGDVGSRLLPLAKVFLIMTRFHEEDLTGTILKYNQDALVESDRYHIVEAPALCYDPENDVLGRALGEVLWDYYDLHYFKRKRSEWKYQRFALVYQQLADAASDTSIASKFQTYQHLPHLDPKVLKARMDAGHVDDRGRPIPDRKEHFRRIVTSVDAAQKKGARNDYTVVQVWGETHDRKHYLIYQERKKVEINDLIEMVERISKRFDVDSILVEDKGNGTAYIQARGQTDSQRRLAPAPIEAIQVPSTYSKEFRFNEVIPMIEAQEVYLPDKAPWLDLFIREVGQFPEGAHDDQVDAMTQYLRWAKSKRSRFGARKVGSMG